jgi:hypothetical protein
MHANGPFAPLAVMGAEFGWLMGEETDLGYPIVSVGTKPTLRLPSATSECSP